ASTATRQLGHDTARGHVHRKHVSMIAVTRDHLVAFLDGHGHAGNDRFLSDIKVAEATNVTHAVELTRLLFEAANQEHVAVSLELLLFGKFSWGRSFRCRWRFRIRPVFLGGRFPGGCRHALAPCSSQCRLGRHAIPIVAKASMCNVCPPRRKCMANMRTNISFYT